MRAALTGRFVMSTIHTNDAIGAIDRLEDIGVELFPKTVHHRLQFIRIAGVEDKTIAVLGKLACTRLSNTRRSAGDKCCFHTLINWFSNTHKRFSYREIPHPPVRSRGRHRVMVPC